MIVTDENDAEIENFVLEANNGLSPRITARSTGEHKVKISHGGGFGNAGGGSLKAGSFQFQLVPVSDPAVGTLRLPTPSALVAVLNTYGDVDRAELAVQPGKAYGVRVRGRETNDVTAATPWIKRANPPGPYTDHNMGKPWVDGVTTVGDLRRTRPVEQGLRRIPGLRHRPARAYRGGADVADLRRPDGATRHPAVPCGHLQG